MRAPTAWFARVAAAWAAEQVDVDPARIVDVDLAAGWHPHTAEPDVPAVVLTVTLDGPHQRHGDTVTDHLHRIHHVLDDPTVALSALAYQAVTSR